MTSAFGNAAVVCQSFSQISANIAVAIFRVDGFRVVSSAHVCRSHSRRRVGDEAATGQNRKAGSIKETDFQYENCIALGWHMYNIRESQSLPSGTGGSPIRGRRL
jgi:hypothetical protein